MALKKRGFNVDRILNQHREERLRVQAETARDREALAKEKATASPKQIDAGPKDHSDTESKISKHPDTASGSVVDGLGGKKGLMERFRGSFKDAKGNDLPASNTATPSMPGGFGGLGKGKFGGGFGGLSGLGGMSGGAGGGQASLGAGAGGSATQSTKRVSYHFV